MNIVKVMIDRVRRTKVTYVIAAIIMTWVIVALSPMVANKITWFSQRTSLNSTQGMQAIQVAKTTTVKQSFASPYEYVKGIRLYFGTNARVNHGRLYVSLNDMSTGELVAAWEEDLQLLDDWAPDDFFADDSIRGGNGHVYEITISVVYENEEDQIAVFQSAEDEYEEGNLKINGDPSAEDLILEVYGYNGGCPQKWIYAIVIGITMAVFAAMLYLYCNHKVSPIFSGTNRIEWGFVAIMLLFGSFLFSQAGDMQITIRHARDLLSAIKDGDLLHYYTVVKDKALEGGYYGRAQIGASAYYNIFLYLFLAISILPLILIEKIFGFTASDNIAVNYVNVILLLLVLVSALLVFKIAKEMRLSGQQAKEAAYIYLSSAILVFATVGFSQLDIVYLIFTLWGLLFYLRRQYVRFSLIMSVAIMLKVFPILAFIPLIVLVEKRLLHIIKYLLLGMSSTIVFKLVFHGDLGYGITQEKLGEIYGFSKSLFSNGVAVFMMSCSLFALCMILLCIAMYDKECTESLLWKYVIFVPLFAFSSFLMFVGWHPQWTVLVAPFMALAIVVDKQRRSLIYLDAGIGLAIFAASAIVFPKNTDNYMANHGIVAILTGHQYSGVTLSDMLNNIDSIAIIIATVFVAMLGYFAVVVTRDLKGAQTVEQLNQNNYLSRWGVWLRIAIMLLYGCALMFMFFYT